MGILRAAAAVIAVKQHAPATAVIAVHIGVHYVHNTIRSTTEVYCYAVLHSSYMKLNRLYMYHLHHCLQLYIQEYMLCMHAMNCTGI
jgi:predicted phosphoribosyltransferase